ncbi:acyltransferase family protein [Nocardia sp. bgisy118]|uniref:acyltransferase family protein n=1 Tax=Nocardia sp. bgisy118 TaxID=3413786 RepID=UPI003F4A25D7
MSTVPSPAAEEAPVELSGRLHSLDALRGMVQLGGVAFHTTLSFIPGFAYAGWVAADRSPSHFLGLLAFIIHMFHMPTFFMLAGFFARMQLRRNSSSRDFLRSRAKRILLPLLFAWLAVLPLIAVLVIVRERTGHLHSVVHKHNVVPFPLAHFWFLWLLYWFLLITTGLYGLFTIFPRAGQFVRASVEAVFNGITRLHIEPLVLAVPVTLGFLCYSPWFLWGGYPAPVMDLVPQPPVLIGYGTAFTLGWFAHKNMHVLLSWRARWPTYLLLAIIATTAVSATGRFVPSAFLATVDGSLTMVPMEGGSKLLYAFGYCLASWLWVLALVGLAQRLMSGFSAWRRYLSTASYWIYLTHVPLVMALQVVVEGWPLHWSVKFAMILVATLFTLLVSYHFLVRPTFVGELLNGRRYPIGSGRSTRTE